MKALSSNEASRSDADNRVIKTMQCFVPADDNPGWKENRQGWAMHQCIRKGTGRPTFRSHIPKDEGYTASASKQAKLQVRCGVGACSRDVWSWVNWQGPSPPIIHGLMSLENAC